MPKLMFRKHLLESLKDPVEAQGYLEIVLNDGDQALILATLNDLVEAQGGVGAVARKAKLPKADFELYLDSGNRPRFKDLLVVVQALGFQFRLERVKSRRPKPKAAARSRA